MIIKCPNCDGYLQFDPITQKMKCDFCDALFAPEEFGEHQDAKPDAMVRPGDEPKKMQWFWKNPDDEEEQTEKENGGEGEDTFEMNIYRCSACGGELMVNGLETSTFCSYCGQPTIVFDRVSKEMKPAWIMPFEITKPQAVGLIREKLSHGAFIPKEVKNFNVEQIRGIYIPYWMVDVYYEDSLYLKGEVGSGKNSRTYYYFRKADLKLARVTMDASRKLADESSQRLEPFNTYKLAPFKPEYMSGFYADRYDVSAKEIEAPAVERTRLIFENEVIKTVPADDVSVVKRNPRTEVSMAEYALLPAWFMTFRYQDEPYTILVNGQTGKVVGGLPFEKGKTYGLLAILSIIFSWIGTMLSYGILKFVGDDEDMIKLLGTILIFGIFAFAQGVKKFKKVKRSIGLTKAKETLDYVSKR